jgi:hypothetical protein
MPARALSPRMKKLWVRAKRKGGQTRFGLGAERILLSIERGLLEEADASVHSTLDVSGYHVASTMATLGPEAARIFRITHIRNVPWILQHGLHCQSSDVADPAFEPIGMRELIEKRTSRIVPIPPGGRLSDYVPFYFTPASIMLFNIKTGYNAVIKRKNAEIAIIVSSLHTLREHRVPFVFTNGHAYMAESDYFDDLEDLKKIDWDLLRRRDFKSDPEDPGKLGRYQAEALAHRHVPVEALLGIVCYESGAKETLQEHVRRLELTIEVRAIPGWYFRE